MNTSSYASRKIFIFSVLHIILGCFAISLGIPAASPTQGSFPWGHLGYGIWGGVLYIYNGCLGMVAGARKTSDLIIWHLVMSIVCAIIGCLQFSLGIASAGQDYYILKLRSSYALANGPTPDPSAVRYYNDLNSFVSKFFEMTGMLATPNNGLTSGVHPGMVAVDSLLAIGGLLVAFFSVLSASSGCRILCCYSLGLDSDAQADTSAPFKHQKSQTDKKVVPAP